MPERTVPIIHQPIFSAIEFLETRRLLSAGHYDHDGSASAPEGSAIVMDINVAIGPDQLLGQESGTSPSDDAGLISQTDPGSNLSAPDGTGNDSSPPLNPGGQPHGHGFWTRGPQPPAHVQPTPPTGGGGDDAGQGNSEATDSGSGGSGIDVTPPPVTVTPPPLDTTPPPTDVTPPPVDVIPPPVDVTPPPVDVDPPPVDVTPPPADVIPPPVDVTPPPVDVTPPPVDVAPPPVDVAPPPVDTTPPPTDVTPPKVTPPVAPPNSAPPGSDSNPPPVASAPPPSAHENTPPTQSGSEDSGSSGQTQATNSGSSSTSATPTQSEALQTTSQAHSDHRATGSQALATENGSSTSAQQSRPEERDSNVASGANAAPVIAPAEPASASVAHPDASTFSEVKIETVDATSTEGTGASTTKTNSENALERLMAMVFGRSPYGHVHGAVSADAPAADVSADQVQVQMLSDVLVDSGEAQLSASSISADAAPVASAQDPELVLARPPEAQASFRAPVDEGGAFNPHNIMAAVLAGVTFGAIHFHRWRKRRHEAAIASARKLASMLTFDPLAVWIDHPRRRR